jgi:predicted enzyme related to lactoylglutathione lyase
MQKVNGIGGFFFKSQNPDNLAKWYEDNLGIDLMTGGGWSQKAGQTVFAPFEEKTEYFGRPDQQFMLNFRVDDLDAMLKQLADNGVKIDDEKMSDENLGKFAWIYDPEGNKIELWEPAK